MENSCGFFCKTKIVPADFADRRRKESVKSATVSEICGKKQRRNKMKKVKVNAYQVGLVFKDGVYERMLTTGKYWFWGREKVMLYDITQPFIAPVELNILLQDALLASVLHVVEVKDN